LTPFILPYGREIGGCAQNLQAEAPLCLGLGVHQLVRDAHLVWKALVQVGEEVHRPNRQIKEPRLVAGLVQQSEERHRLRGCEPGGRDVPERGLALRRNRDRLHETRSVQNLNHLESLGAAPLDPLDRYGEFVERDRRGERVDPAVQPEVWKQRKETGPEPPV